MSRYVISANGDDTYEPYQPTSNIDNITGEEFDSPEELKKERGPFFSCDGAIHDPHFHEVKKYPYADIDDEDGKYKTTIHQMHVPGFDQFDTFPHEKITENDPYHSITGWQLGISDLTNNVYFNHFSSMQVFPKTTDNQEALQTWKDQVQHVFGEGEFKEKDVFSNAPKEIRDHLNDEEFNSLKNITHHVTFHPKNYDYGEIFYTGRYQIGDYVRPAIASTNVTFEKNTPEEGKAELVELASRAKEHAQRNLEKKIQESPQNWEDRFRMSKRMYTLGENGKILDIQDYNVGFVTKSSKCQCSQCLENPNANRDFW
jgi:hypothetical protein